MTRPGDMNSEEFRLARNATIVPREPEDRAVVLDGDGWAWQRSGNVWTTTTTLMAPHDWGGLVTHRGPLTVLRPEPVAQAHHVGSWAITDGECACECPRCYRGEQCICPECTEGWGHDHA